MRPPPPAQQRLPHRPAVAAADRLRRQRPIPLLRLRPTRRLPATTDRGSGGTGAPAARRPRAGSAGTAPTATAGDGAVAVGQKAIFYEERTNVAEGSAEAGTIVWSLVQQSPGNDLPPEPAIRAEAKIPGKDLSCA